MASFCRWAVRHDLLGANSMDKIGTIKVPWRLPRPAVAADVAGVLAVIGSRRPRKDLPVGRLRDRVLFEAAYVCGGDTEDQKRWVTAWRLVDQGKAAHVRAAGNIVPMARPDSR